MSKTALFTRGPRRSKLAALGVVLGLVGSSAALITTTNPASAGGPMYVEVEVTTTEDVVDAGDGVLSLREAVDEANGDGQDTEILLEAGATYLLDECGGGVDEAANVGGDLDHTEVGLLRIAGDDTTIEQTCNGERVLQDVNPDAPMYISGLRITGGRTTGSGGGVLIGGGGYVSASIIEGNVSGHVNGGGGVAASLDLSINGSIVRDNVAAGNGGGVRSFGFVAVFDSTLSGNSSGGSGGGVSAGTKLNVQRSTITGNRASVEGGGATSTSDDAEIGGSTVTANRAPDGANVAADDSVILERSIVALGSQGVDCVSGDPVQNDGGNLGYDPSCGAAGANDLPAMHPMLAPLAVPDGETTASMQPTIGSPAIDLIPAASCVGAVDQHGTPRPQGGMCDSGSFEGVAEVCTPQFTDVGAGHPFFEDICWLDQAGITTGYANGSFGAGQPVSRQAMAAFLYRLALAPPPPALPPTFDDVPTDHPFAREIGWLADEGISEGYGDGTFRPGDAVTRQAMAAFLNRVAGEPIIAIIAGSQSFSDVSPEHPFYGPIEWMAQAGVSEGYIDGTWQPAAPVTRQAMAAFLQRMAEGVVLAGL
jgi:hypothetical protein